MNRVLTGVGAPNHPLQQTAAAGLVSGTSSSLRRRPLLSWVDYEAVVEIKRKTRDFLFFVSPDSNSLA